MLLRLCNPKPDLLDEVSRDLFRPDLSIQSRLASPEIGFRSLDELGFLVKLPEEEEAQIDRDDDVSTGKRVSTRNKSIAGGGYEDSKSNLRSDKVLDRPVGRAGDSVVGEDLPAVEDDDDDEEDQRGVSCEGLELRVEGPVCACDTLGVAGFAETEEGDEDGDPGEEGGDGCELCSGSALAGKHRHSRRQLTVWNHPKTLFAPDETVM